MLLQDHNDTRTPNNRWHQHIHPTNRPSGALSLSLSLYVPRPAETPRDDIRLAPRLPQAPAPQQTELPHHGECRRRGLRPMRPARAARARAPKRAHGAQRRKGTRARGRAARGQRHARARSACMAHMARDVRRALLRLGGAPARQRVQTSALEGVRVRAVKAHGASRARHACRTRHTQRAQGKRRAQGRTPEGAAPSICARSRPRHAQGTRLAPSTRRAQGRGVGCARSGGVRVASAMCARRRPSERASRW